LRAGVDFINAHRHQGPVYVHCKIGYSRSAALVASWLMNLGDATTPEEALARIRTVRPRLVVRPEVVCVLPHSPRPNGAVDEAVPPLIEVRS